MPAFNFAQFKDDMARAIFGQSLTDAISNGTCLKCKQNAISKCYSDAGIKEYYISGLCEECFDKITKECA